MRVGKLGKVGEAAAGRALGIGGAGCQAALVNDHACITFLAVFVGAAAVIFRGVLFTALTGRNTEVPAHVVCAFVRIVIRAALHVVTRLVDWHADGTIRSRAGVVAVWAALTIRAA